MLGFQQPDSVLELVNFKCGAFGVAVILTSEVPGTEVSRTWWVLKDVKGACVQRPHPGLWSTTCLFCGKMDAWYRVRAPGKDALLAFSAPTWPSFLLWISLFLEIFFFPACLLCAVPFYHICHLMAELFIHSIRLIDTWFFSKLIKAFVINRSEPRHPGVRPFVCSACEDAGLDSLSIHTG